MNEPALIQDAQHGNLDAFNTWSGMFYPFFGETHIVITARQTT